MTGQLNRAPGKAALVVATVALVIVTGRVGLLLPDRASPRQTVRTRGTRCMRPRLTPWASIGGCGAASGGAAHEAQLQWIGRGVSGSLVDLEAQGIFSVAADTAFNPSESFDGRMRMQTSSLLVKLGFHPQWADLRLSLPILSRRGFGVQVGGLGDAAVEVIRPWGMSGNFRTTLGTTFPTGRYDVPLTAKQRLVVPEMQLGTGTLAGAFRLEYGMDRDWGLFNVGVSYEAGLWALQTTDYDYDTTLRTVVVRNRQLEPSREGRGVVNDIGTVYPDVVSLLADAGIKRGGLVHGFSTSLLVPLRRGEYFQRGLGSPYREFSIDPDAAEYAADKRAAQQHADTVIGFNDSLRYDNPLVVGVDNEGRWMVVERTRIGQKTFPGLVLRYSVEKSDPELPLLFGCAVRTEFDGGVRFAGFSAGIGMKLSLL